MLRAFWFLLLSMFAETGYGDAGDPDAGDPSGNGDADKQEKDAALEAAFDATKDPAAKFHAMQDHIGRLHRRLDERDKHIRALEAEMDSGGGNGGDGTPSGDAHELRLENAFLRSAMAADAPLDLDTAWDLLRVRGFVDTVNVGDDGKVTGMDDALAKLVERYPWLADAPTPPEPRPSPPAIKGARKRQDPSAGLSRSGLESRFPALKRGR